VSSPAQEPKRSRSSSATRAAKALRGPGWSSIATAGDLLQWHPHLHLITTDGGRTPGGSWHLLPQWDGVRLMMLFRERLLKSLLDKHAIFQELVKKLLAWRHPGFSAHVGEPISASDQQRLEDTAAYLVRNLRSLKKSVLHQPDPRTPRLALAAAGQPPPAREILRVAEQGEGWGVPPSWD